MSALVKSTHPVSVNTFDTNVVEGEVFLKHYRLNHADDRARLEIARNGPAITYRGSDVQSGAPVAITLVPAASIDPVASERFEEKARASILLDHINIARTVGFDTDEDQFVFVSEYPQGETVERWVATHGPMPPDAVLRVALQVIAALGAGSFHDLHHPAVQPSNLIIVPGKTAEGGWPLVKLMHFGLAGLKVAPGQPVRDWVISDFASPEQLLRGTVDFRSEIYSLGATMCYLLTGVFYSAQPRAPQARRFARPLRTLIVKTLADDPNERPHDPVLFTEELRDCLSKIERRQELRNKFGIPLGPVVAKPDRRSTVHESLARPVGPIPPPNPVSPRWVPGRALAMLALLLGLGIAALLLVPEDVVTAALHRNKSIKTIGVAVGVPNPDPGETNLPNEASSADLAPTAGSSPESSQAPSGLVRPAPQVQPPADQALVSSASSGNTVALTAESPAPAGASASSASPASSPIQLAANNLPEAAAPPRVGPGTDSPAGTEEGFSNPARKDEQLRDAGRENAEKNSSPSTAASAGEKQHRTTVISKKNTKKSSAAVKGTRDQNDDLHRSRSRLSRRGTARPRIVGMTPGGNLILRLPSGRIVFVHPDGTGHSYSDDLPPQRHVIIERRALTVPPPPLEPFRLDPYGD